MLTASLTLDPAMRVGPVHRRTFGSFVEHLGRCVYTGIYEPQHPTADEDGFRKDVLELIRELGPTVVRYPGGNFVSGYQWEDGIGPRELRPARRDLAWRSTETNEIGLDEFMRWTTKASVEPMLAVNLGTRGITEALDLLEYATHPAGTAWADRRIANGSPDPYDIRLWCLGNEMDGPWQLGHKTAREYGRLAAETARAMRQAHPNLELVACGSSSSAMPTFGQWEATVLEETYDLVDYISLHAYYEETDGDRASFLASAVDMDHFIDSVVATADHIGAKLGQRKRINLAFDEWNVWYTQRYEDQGPPPGWPRAPRLLEDVYSVVDAVVVGGLLISLLRHSDRVAIACQAQLVNVIAPIMTEPDGSAWRQTTFHPFAQASRYARGNVLRTEPTGPRLDTKRFGDVPAIDTVATHDPETGQVALFAINRSQHHPIQLDIDARSLGAVQVLSCHQLHDDDPTAHNTADRPERVKPKATQHHSVDGNKITVVLPPVSWTVLRLTHTL